MAHYEIFEERIDENVEALKLAFGWVDEFDWIRFKPAYSVKTNFTPMIIRRFHEKGFLIEVVSDMEVEIAMMAGIPMRHIVYNGPMKGELAGIVALKGGILCFDSLDDLTHRNYQKGTKCMFRVAVNVGNGVDTRFGSRPDEIRGLIEAAIEKGYKPVGIHCHVTRARDLESWSRKIDAMADVYARVKDLLIDEGIVDFGGNMYSPMTVEKRAEYDDYAGYVDYSKLFQSKAALFKGATLMLEMGTSIVSNCMNFVANVMSIKHTDENTYVLLDASRYHLGWATDRYNFQMNVHRTDESKDIEHVEGAELVGMLCTEGDYLYRGFTGDIAVGDAVEFLNVGAYTIGVKPPFIVPHDEAIYVYGDGKLKLAKTEETCQDVMRTYSWR